MRIAFTGDICFAQYFRGLESKTDVLSDEIKRFLASSDYCVGNIEGAVYSPPGGSKGKFAHSSDEKTGAFLKENGISIWNLANNHILDYEDEGIASTIRSCRESGSKWIGLQKNEPPQPLVLQEEDGVGLFAVTYSEPAMRAYKGEYGYIDWDDYDSVQKAIHSIKQTCRWCIIVAHGGEEFSHLPMPDTRSRYHKYLEMGADVVVGHHPHVVQNYEQTGEKILFYSLGNFIFDTDYERAHKHTDCGVIVRLTFSDGKMTWDSLSVRIDRDSHRIVPGKELPVFINIDAKKYREIYPFAAKALSRAEKKTLAFLHPEKYEKAGALTWTLRDLRLFRHQSFRKKIAGKYMASFCRKPESKIMNYIFE